MLTILKINYEYIYFDLFLKKKMLSLRFIYSVHFIKLERELWRKVCLPPDALSLHRGSYLYLGLGAELCYGSLAVWLGTCDGFLYLLDLFGVGGLILLGSKRRCIFNLPNCYSFIDRG